MTFQTITFAGHSSVFITAGEKTIAIDPWLAGNPVCPEELKQPDRIDLIVLSHGHFDHAAEASQLAKQYGSTIAATFELAALMQQEGVAEDKTIPMNTGGTVLWEGCSVTLTPALHSSSYEGPNGVVYAGDACGIVLGDGRRNIYHAGDTALFTDLKLIGEKYRPEVAFIPIGDRFTMGPDEAATATKLIGCKTAIPVHHSTFDLLTGTVEQYAQACKDLDVEIVELKPGGKYPL